MDGQNIPIDINTGKLLEWLISRRHVNKDWQANILKIREKINLAIQDMPEHEGILKLLTGQHINYFHCLKIIEILKETEADSKNLFGMYGSQRMKDWQNIVSLYQKDNVYLAEAAQVLMRNVNFEVPGLRKQVSKLEQIQDECEKKIKDYSKSESSALKDFNASCEQLGIAGKSIKNELLELLKELPRMYENSLYKIKTVSPAIELYEAFTTFQSESEKADVVTILKYLIQKGNTTTYEYIYGEAPLNIEEPQIELRTNSENEAAELDDNAEIDFGDSIDFGDVNADDQIDFGNPTEQAGEIDWGASNNEEGFEIVTHGDVQNLEESGIVVEASGNDGGTARGDEALTILDNPKTREQIINDLFELDSFLRLRLFEMSSDSDLLSMSQMQNASSIMQMQTCESITAHLDCVSVALIELTNKRIQHLHNVKHSPKYVDILTTNLKQKLSLVERMKTSKKLLEEKIGDLRKQVAELKPSIDFLIQKTKELQKEIENDVSKKYKGRTVNIVGGVNML